MESTVSKTLFAVLGGACLIARAETLVEAPRDLPLIADVDVVVAGGGFAAAGAALSAHEAGASVFVVMPRQNPADDIISTRRLWAQEGDENLDDPLLASSIPTTHDAKFSYTPSIEATNSAHLDNAHTVLCDGAWGSDERETVQYDGSVNISISPQEGDYNVTSVTVHYHVKSNYGSAGFKVLVGGEEVEGAQELLTKSSYRTWVFTPSVPFSRQAFTLHSDRSDGAVRQLLGEVIVGTDADFATVAATPAAFFKSIDTALREAGVDYFTGAVVTDVLRDEAGQIAGVVIADRSGRQAIRAKAVVDATEWGNVARKAAQMHSRGNGMVRFTRVMAVNAEDAISLPAGYSFTEVPIAAATATITPYDLHPDKRSFGYALKNIAVSREFEMPEMDYMCVNSINQQMRDEVWFRSTVDQSEKPFFVPPDAIVGANGTVNEWTGSASVPLSAFAPAGVGNMWVAGMAADVASSLAEKLSYPGVGAALGRRIGAAAAEKARTVALAGAVSCGQAVVAASGVEVREPLRRPINVGNESSSTVTSKGAELPVVADVDVLVVGGGTAGGPAAIAAAGEGKRTMVLEWLYVMGGVTTEGRIGRYYKANPRGFTKNFVDARTMGAQALGDCFYEVKSETFRRGATERGATVVFGAMSEGALVDGADADGRAKVRGAVAVLPDGTRGVVKARVVVDATGNADIAAVAGAETMFLSPNEFAMQGSAASTHLLGDSYRNSDLGFLNAPDAGDLSHFAKRARRGTPDKTWNLSNVIAGSRERRRIVGDFIVTELDEMRQRTYPDTIMHGESNYDMHGYSSSDLMMFYETTHGEIFKADLPYRALIPAALEGVYATGLSVSATRDAMPIIRMQPSVQNQGYAVGLAAAMAADAGGVRAIDVKALQRRLVDDGCLDERVLTDVDSGDDRSGLAEAVANLGPTFRGKEFVLSFPGDALPLLQAAYESEADASNKVAKAAALMVLGDDRGFDVVTNALAEAAWQAGSNFRGLGNFGRQTAFDDCLLFALAHSGDRRAEGVLADYANRLADSANTVRNLSHWRMLARAAEMKKSARIAANIALAAARGGNAVEGAAKSGVPDAVAAGSENNSQDAERNKVLRELAELRARYRLGDKKAEARLKAYLNDYRTIYAEWAALVLNQPPLGAIVGEWQDANTLVIDLGRPSAPNAYTGVVEVSDATLRFLSEADEAPVSGAWNFTLLHGGDFEPQEPLAGATAALDKRAKSDAAWLLTNVANWMFDSTNDGSGITKDGSYFASDNRIGTRGHSAFLFKTSSSGGLGPISRTLAIPESGEYALAFDYTSRHNAGTTYPVRIVVSLDGTELGTCGGAKKYDSWQTQVVELGTLAAGEHTLSFSIPSVNDTGVLLDNVRLGVPSEPAPAAVFPADLLKALTVKVSQDTSLELKGDFRLQVRAFYRDGGHWIGEAVATSPEGGEGVLVSRPFPFIIRITGG